MSNKVSQINELKTHFYSCGEMPFGTSRRAGNRSCVNELKTHYYSCGEMPFGTSRRAGNNGRLGVPEWKSPYYTPNDGAELWEFFSDGSQVLKAKFSTTQNKFIPIQ